jgi:nucleoside-diphosphate-sugar epimerase
MIVGSGLLASALAHRYALDEDVLVFASGVSNSGETRVSEFQREANLLHATARNYSRKHFVYFSTCSIDDPDRLASPYVRHKIEMESCVELFPSYSIFRLPQVVGTTENTHTLTNFLYKKIVSGEPFTVWSGAWRYLIDVADVALIAEAMIGSQDYRARPVNIASSHPIKMPELVKIFERVLQRDAACQSVVRGENYVIDVRDTQQIVNSCGIEFDSGYVERTIGKYYGNKE